MKLRLGLLLLLAGTAGLLVLASSQGDEPGPALGFQPQVFVVNADGTQLQQLTKGKGYRFAPTWSPDGRRLAYAGDGINVITLATGKARTLPGSRIRGGPSVIAWSPARDGILLKHGAGTENRPRTGIATISADGRRIRRLVSWPSSRSQLGGPQWSPDGQRIAYLREGKPKSTGGPLGIVSGGNYDVHVISRGGRGNKRVRLRGDERQPRWSPDGKWLLLGRRIGRETATDSKFGLWKMSPRGRHLQRVGPQIVNADDPTWSHDGKRVGFAGHSDTGARNQALFVMDAMPAGVPRLIVEHVSAAVWSPVEDLIAFTDYDGHVRVTAPDGSGQRTLATFAPDTEFRYLSWSRDGRRLAFTAEKERPSD